MCGQEQHQTQTPVHFTAGLERRTLLRASLELFGLILVRALAVDLRGNHRGTGGTGGIICRHEMGRRVQAAIERIDGLLRADDGSARMGQHIHGQIVRIGVGDIQMFAIHIDRRRKTTLVDHLDQFRRNGLGAEPRSDGIQSESRHRSLRHAWRGTRRMLRLMCGSGGNGHGPGQIIRRGENRQILVSKEQAHTWLIAKLQSIGGEILPFGFGRIFRLA